ncbi:MAG: hypothetical protein IJ078_07975 [Succinivibrionaceae bacterium]|nr:hypothetical protein [Succinivibrionaceae bacterium]
MNKNQTSSIEEEAIATISGQTSYSSIEYNQQCNVILPPQAEKLCIDLQDVNQIIQICNEAKRKTFPWGELLLALSMLCLGGEFGSWGGNLPSSFSGLQVLFLILGVAFLVAFFFIRKEQSKDVKHFAERIEDSMSRCASSYHKSEE